MDTKNRHIVNLKYANSKRRMYLTWNGDHASDGALELKSLMNHVENTLGPSSNNAEEFYLKCAEYFRQNDFAEFKG